MDPAEALAVAQRVARALPLPHADLHTPRVALAHVLRMPAFVPHPSSHRHAIIFTPGDDGCALLWSAELFAPCCHAALLAKRANCGVRSHSTLAHVAHRQEVLAFTLQLLPLLSHVACHPPAK